MLSHQIEFSKACAEIYKPISGRASDPDALISEGNADGIEAADEYVSIVEELQANLKPELEMIETRIIRPADEMLEMIKFIRKQTKKRDHKQLDYDRHKATLKKLQDKKDKSMKDEKALYKAENDVEQATQEYDYFNDLMKDELPRLFALQREFIRPLFQSFYYMQLNVFYTLHEKMQNMDIGYFNLTLDIEEAFEMKRGEVKEAAEQLSIVRFKATGGRRPKPAYGSRPAVGGASSRPAIENGVSTLAIEEGPSSSSHSPSRPSSDYAPPPYSSSNGMLTITNGATSSSLAAAASGKAKPPPPKPKPGRLSQVPAVETCTALYDYEAQAAGDLSFAAGEVIEIIQRTSSENEWWTGKVSGRQGQFPGMYGSCSPWSSMLIANRQLRTDELIRPTQKWYTHRPHKFTSAQAQRSIFHLLLQTIGSLC